MRRMQTWNVAPVVAAVAAVLSASALGAQEEDRAYLGLRARGATAEDVAKLGAEVDAPVVSIVDGGSPAEKAGFQVDDVIAMLQGNPVKTGKDLGAAIGAMKPGAEIVFVVKRAKQDTELKVTLASKRAYESMVGEAAPELAVAGWAGEETPLAKLKGNVVVLFFFTMIEKPSQDMKNAVDLWVVQYQDKAVKFVGAHTPASPAHMGEQGLEQVRKYVAENKFSFPVAVSALGEAGQPPRFLRDYRLKGLPTFVVVDAAGVVRYKTTPGAKMNLLEIEKAINDLLGAGGGEKK